MGVGSADSGSGGHGRDAGVGGSTLRRGGSARALLVRCRNILHVPVLIEEVLAMRDEIDRWLAAHPEGGKR